MNINHLSKGLRILDKTEGDISVVTTDLNDILKEFYFGGSFNWSILEVDTNGYHGCMTSLKDLKDTAVNHPKGFILSWEELCAFGNDVNQFLNLTLVGSDPSHIFSWSDNALRRYESSHVYIEMFDCSYWEVFSKDYAFIERLENKFKNTEKLSPDFKEKNKQ